MPSIEELTVEEQVRLAQAAGVLPVGLRPSEVRQRKVQPNGSKAKEPLINQIPSQIDGATIHHVPIEAMDSQEEEEEDEDEDEDENEDYDDGAEMMRQRKRVEEQRPPDFADEIFNVIMYLIPYSTLFLMLDILSHKQYSQHPEIDDYAIRLLQAIPTIAVLTFYANRYEKHWVTNPVLMTTSIVAGCRLVWLMNKANWRMVTEQAPPVGTMWIFAIVQLPVGRAVITLLAVFIWCWRNQMRLFPS